jgi:hypothetical protein
MNFLSRDKQIEVISVLTEGLGIRATARLTGVNRETVGTLALRVGRDCAKLHDRMMVGRTRIYFHKLCGAAKFVAAHGVTPVHEIDQWF